MNMRIILIIWMVSLHYSISASIMAPFLEKIKVWEYYKYENGSYHNYALVINTLDSDVTLTICKWRRWYVKPFPPLSSGYVISSGRIGVETDDSTKWGKLAATTGDTLKYNIKLKAHEKKVIPDFFESIRRSTLDTVYQRNRLQFNQLTLLANGEYAGAYTLKKIILPDSIPRSGIISCTMINTGEPLPFFVHFQDTKFKRGKLYHLSVYCYQKVIWTRAR